ncbi:MAG: hypothetical protein QG574_2090 [Cyanobacteriota bacterium erpe_2018_sw_21hr_WHONDRS-SW48-000092_B_bin.40]|jgi:hypothetical protein|nr:hypothetical protein [Cyanobacteriota bacterium erpe_2018_sw_21hr_WHONDRS-SW48-000092_B_bin.40]
MEPNSEPNANVQNAEQANIEPPKASTDAKALYPHDVLANSELSDKLSGALQNPQVSRYLGKATKVVVACAISGCILLLIAIFAVVNVLTMITSQIPQ